MHDPSDDEQSVSYPAPLALSDVVERELGLRTGTLGAVPIALPDQYIPPEDHRDVVDDFTIWPPSERQFLVGKHLEVVLTFDRGGCELAELQYEFRPPCPDLLYRRDAGAVQIGAIADLRRHLGQEEFEQLILQSIRRLSTKRRSRYRRCAHCREMMPPGAFFEGAICFGCAPEVFGLVF